MPIHPPDMKTEAAMADQWFVGRGGQKAGPYTTEQLQQLAAACQLVESDLLWKQGLETWVPVSQVTGLLPATPGGTLPPLDLESRAGGPGEWNPYQASTIPIGSDTAGSTTMVYADFLPRVAAYLIDTVVITVAAWVLQAGATAFGAVTLGDREAGMAVGSLLGSLMSFLGSLAYYVAFESSERQGTYGKQLLGIKVTDMEGRRISAGRAVGRYFAKIITGLTCGIGMLLPLFTDRRQTLHDMICGCLALKK